MNMFTVIANVVILLTIIVIVFSILAVLARLLSDRRQVRIHRTRVHMSEAVHHYLTQGSNINDLIRELEKDEETALGVLIEIASQLSRKGRMQLNPVFSHFQYVKKEMDALQSRQWSVRAGAATRLGYMCHADAVPVLINKLEDEMLDVRLAAAHALAQLGATLAIRPILHALALPADWPLQRCTEILIEMGPETADPLLAYLAEKGSQANDPAILVAMRVLGKLQVHRAAPLFVKFLSSPDTELRLATAKAMGQIGGTHYVDELCALVNDPVWEVRSAAAQALGRIKNEKVIAPLTKALCDSAWWVRFNAANSLHALGQQGLKALTYSSANNSDEFARDICRQILEEHGAVPMHGGQPT